MLADQVVHFYGREFVQGNEHGFALVAPVAKMPNYIFGDRIQSFFGSKDGVFTGKKLLNPAALVAVVVFGFRIDGRPNLLVDRGVIQAQVLSTVFIVQWHRSTVVHTALEVVARYVIAKNAPGQFIVFEEGRTRKTHKRGIGQGIAQVHGQVAALGAVGLIGNDDDVVALGNEFLKIEFVDEGKQVAVLDAQQFFQMFAAVGFERVFAPGLDLRHRPYPTERAINLGVQLIAVGHNQKRVAPGKLAVDFLTKKDHRIRLATALGMPKHPQFLFLF